MFTIMHRHNDGTETTYEAQTVIRETNGEPTIPPCGDIILRGVTPADGELVGGGAGACGEGGNTIRISPRMFAKEGFDEARVFVMNRFGATVARHILFRPVHLGDNIHEAHGPSDPA